MDADGRKAKVILIGAPHGSERPKHDTNDTELERKTSKTLSSAF
jgi:hypothetical protein